MDKYQNIVNVLARLWISMSMKYQFYEVDGRVIFWINTIKTVFGASVFAFDDTL